MNFLGVAFVGKRALAHTEDNLSTTVVENEEIVGNGVDAKTFYFTGATEVGHLSEELNTATQLRILLLLLFKPIKYSLCCPWILECVAFHRSMVNLPGHTLERGKKMRRRATQ